MFPGLRGGAVAAAAAGLERKTTAGPGRGGSTCPPHPPAGLGFNPRFHLLPIYHPLITLILDHLHPSERRTPGHAADGLPL